MFKKERQAYILRQVNLHNKVIIAGLCLDMGVSEDTVRRDLQELSDAGKLIRVHGGALSTAFSGLQFVPENVYSQLQKKTIALKAINLIKDHMYVITSGGTTILEMVHNIPPSRQATIITGSLPVINACISCPGLEVIVVGDKLSRDSKLTVGTNAIHQIQALNADLCFLGINAIDVQHGVTDSDREVVQVKKSMISAAAKVVCMTIAEKLQSHQPIQVCELKKINYLITELDPGHPSLRPFVDAGITVL
ncbi:MAG: DeoR/GlpR transcriptional regulator [Chitinophagaceae bacterium]|nr:MAG: DeoR/GlpR transcriptional regulator [Chitinophagaceae bacterium]